MKKLLSLTLITLLFIGCSKDPVDNEFSECEQSLELDLSKVDAVTGLIEFDIIPDLVTQDSTTKGSITSGSKDKLWEKGIINYSIQPNLEVAGGIMMGFNDEEDRELIRATLKDFSTQTGILFIEHDYYELKYSDLDGISITRGFMGGSSHLGKQGGIQRVLLPSGLQASITHHEFMHAIGIRHEFTRKDRDEYVIVNWDNIPERMHRQFYVDEYSIDCGDFDMLSIMMYGSYEIRQDSTKVEMSLLNGETFVRSEVLSEKDIRTAKLLYKTEFEKR